MISYDDPTKTTTKKRRAGGIAMHKKESTPKSARWERKPSSAKNGKAHTQTNADIPILPARFHPTQLASPTSINIVKAQFQRANR